MSLSMFARRNGTLLKPTGHESRASDGRPAAFAMRTSLGWLRTVAGASRAWMFAWLWVAPVVADELHWAWNGDTHILRGEVLARTEQRLWFRAVDQRIWTIEAASIRAWHHCESPPLTANELEVVLAQRFPACQVSRSSHFLFVSDLPAAQAKRYLQLLERVHREFFAMWQELGWELQPPAIPCVAVLLADSAEFARLNADEFGAEAAVPPAFYGKRSNWVAVSAEPSAAWRDVVARNVALSHAFANQLATNLVHETTHQLMMNSGMQSRLAEPPRWVSEGLAVYFEGNSPYDADLWQRPGVANRVRLPLLQAAVQTTRDDPLTDYLFEEEGFLDPAQAPARYSLAWGWCHFLLRRYPQPFVAYLQQQSRTGSATDVSRPASPAERSAEFAACFPVPLAQLEKEFRRYALRLQ